MILLGFRLHIEGSAIALAGPSVFHRENIVVERPKPFVFFCFNVALRLWQNCLVDCRRCPELWHRGIRNQPFHKGLLVFEGGFGGVYGCGERGNRSALTRLEFPLEPCTAPIAV